MATDVKAAIAPAFRVPSMERGTLLMIVLIAAMGFCVVYPLILILANSFN